VISVTGKVTVGLLESNGIGFMANVTCGLTAKKPGSAQCPKLVIGYFTLVFLYLAWRQS